MTAKLSAAGLLAIAGLHAVWATGSPWPMADARALAEAAGGRPGGRVHTPAECLAVAGLLAWSSALLAGLPRGTPRLQRTGAAGVIGVLATRGVFGLAGRTDLLSPGATSERFRTLDRRLYSPICLALGAMAVPAAR